MRTRDRLALRRSIARGVHHTLSGYLNARPGDTCRDMWLSATGRTWRGPGVDEECQAAIAVVDAALSAWLGGGEP